MTNDINLFRKENSIYLKKVSSKSQISAKDECAGYLIESNEKEARKIIEGLKGKNKIFALMGGDNALNRRAIETLRINYLVSPEKGKRKDSLKQRDSGLNHVLVRECVKKNISILLDFNDILKLTGKERARRISKIMQNIVICRKANCNIKIASLAINSDEIILPRERIDFGKSIGMESLQAYQAVLFNHNL
jgi:RNase P/RNase MRP subunit p30